MFVVLFVVLTGLAFLCMVHHTEPAAIAANPYQCQYARAGNDLSVIACAWLQTLPG